MKIYLSKSEQSQIKTADCAHIMTISLQIEITMKRTYFNTFLQFHGNSDCHKCIYKKTC